MADAHVIPVNSAAAIAWKAERRLAQREQVWNRLAERGLVWQPDPDRTPGPGAILTLSSPGEWTAEHLKDAALHVLRVEAALNEMNWTLGSAAAHWVQFAGCRPAWISQTVLHPRRRKEWMAREEFEAGFLSPLLRHCSRQGGSHCLRRWSGALLALIRSVSGGRDPEPLAELEDLVQRLTPRRRWSPWQICTRAMEPAGLAEILVKEEAVRRGARLIYEWRGRKSSTAPLRPWPGVAWVRFHEDEEEAAADYLEQHALRACVLPLWNRTGDPTAACPQRPEADLLVATGRGNVPAAAPELARFAQVIRRMAPAALVEFAGGEDPASWNLFVDTLRHGFRFSRVTETGAGRRLCLLERI